MEETVRVDHGGRIHHARWQVEGLRLLSAAPWEGRCEPTGLLPHGTGRLLAPIEPSKIIGVGRNYREHAAEMGSSVPKQPLLFLKPPSSLSPAGQAVELPQLSNHVEYEAELGVVIGTRARAVTEAEALGHVYGYLPVCDITARDLQRSDGQWARAKGFDGFCPVGPAVSSSIASPGSLPVRLWLNGELRQDGNTADMVFGVGHLISHISQTMTLEPGDLIVTGTPSGVGPLHAGDTVRIQVGPCRELNFGIAGA